MGPGGYSPCRFGCPALIASSVLLYVLVVCGFTVFGHPNSQKDVDGGGLIQGLSAAIVMLSMAIAVAAVLMITYCAVCMSIHDVEGGPLRPPGMRAPAPVPWPPRRRSRPRARPPPPHPVP